VGEEQTYVAQGLDQYNNPMAGIAFTWTSSDDGANDNAIAIFHGGVATGVSPGVMHVRREIRLPGYEEWGLTLQTAADVGDE
jgi:hypothetical protein